MPSSPEAIDGIAAICGAEEEIARTAGRGGAAVLRDSGIEFGRVRSAFANALHMQQPLIPAGGDDLRTATIISNLKYMMDHQDEGDNHNAPVFEWCYKRIAEFVPELVGEGKQPRIMLDYSGCLFDGLRTMGADDVLDALVHVTQNPDTRPCVEWLGTPWGHAVAPSTPVQDYRLHVQAWQHHFASLFGMEALERVRGFSPAEMAIPNHPDVAYEFVKTLRECGFAWVLVQEHTVEQLNGHGLEHRHIPNRLVCKNSSGDTVSITALIKTQGSDTKLVAQMQPYYEARGLHRCDVHGKQIPPLVSQIGDGENGGVMMNEFPSKFMEVMREASGTETPPMNGTEYLEHVFALGVSPDEFPACQPIQQSKIWARFTDGDGPERLEEAIEACRQEDQPFHMEGGSWTNNISWIRGYEDLMGPMEEASAAFNETVLQAGVPTTDPRYRNALYHLLCSQTSCYRYWGQGRWTDYGKEICRRVVEILDNDF